MLISGALAPGERLNEAALAEKLAVSRGPVREATRALAGKGMLTVIPGRGVFVRKLSNKEIAENYDVRALLTGLICSVAAKKRTDTDLLELDRLIEEMDSADFSEYYRINISFHEAIGKIADHSCASRFYEEIHYDLSRGMHNLRRSLAVPQQTNEEHRRMVNAIRLGDFHAARRIGEEHVFNGKERWKESLLE